MFAWWNGAWEPVDHAIAPFASAYTASGTETKPPLAKRALVALAGGGGGGGSGRRGAAGSARSGGLGGFGSVLVELLLQASALSSTVTVTIGAGGTGGAAITADSTSGNDGTAGGDTTFGAYLRARGAIGGKGGTAAATSPFAVADDPVGGLASTTSSITADLSPGVINGAHSGRSGCPGGTGGSITTGNAELAGQYGSYPWADPAAVKTTKGSAGSAGSNGANSTIPGITGAGGGAGGANPSGAGGQGGQGGRGSGAAAAALRSMALTHERAATAAMGLPRSRGTSNDEAKWDGHPNLRDLNHAASSRSRHR